MLDNLLAFIVIGCVLIAIVLSKAFSMSKGDKACRVYSFTTFPLWLLYSLNKSYTSANLLNIRIRIGLPEGIPFSHPLHGRPQEEPVVNDTRLSSL
jgi:hypothetical protein